jgi:hypothetical protein
VRLLWVPRIVQGSTLLRSRRSKYQWPLRQRLKLLISPVTSRRPKLSVSAASIRPTTSLTDHASPDGRPPAAAWEAGCCPLMAPIR